MTRDEEIHQIGVKVKERRLRLKLTQMGLSRRSGISQATISKIENGLMEPGCIVLKQIAIALEINLRPWWLD